MPKAVLAANLQSTEDEKHWSLEKGNNNAACAHICYCATNHHRFRHSPTQHYAANKHIENTLKYRFHRGYRATYAATFPTTSELSELATTGAIHLCRPRGIGLAPRCNDSHVSRQDARHTTHQVCCKGSTLA